MTNRYTHSRTEIYDSTLVNTEDCIATAKDHYYASLIADALNYKEESHQKYMAEREAGL